MTTIADIFELTSIDSNPEGCRAKLRPLMDCSIYKAHFPGSPVTPGACIVDAVSDLLAIHHKQPVCLTGVKNAKFISPIIPDDNTVVTVDIKTDGQHATALIQEEIESADGGNTPQLRCKLSLCYTIL